MFYFVLGNRNAIGYNRKRMNSICTLRNSQNKIDKSEIVDIVFLFFLSAFPALFSIAGLSKKILLGENNNSWLSVHFSTWFPLLLIVGMLLYVFFASLFISRRKKKQAIKASPWLISFFGLMILCRAITNYASPYGAFSIEILSPFDQTIKSFSYEGVSFLNRTLSFLAESFSLSYMLLLLVFIPTLDKKAFKKVFQYVLILIYLAFLVMKLYSYIKEMDEIENNFMLLAGKKAGVILPVTSFTTHKNMYGFFLWISSLSLLFLYFYHKRFGYFFLVLMAFDFVTCFCAASRLPSLLIFLTMGFLLFYMAVFDLKRNKANGILSIILLSFFVIFLLVMALGYNETPLGKKIVYLFSSFRDYRTLTTRGVLHKRALGLFSTPFSHLFGYGKEPYLYFFYESGVQMGLELVDFAHSAYIDMLVSYGWISFLLLMGFYAFLLYQIGYLLYRKDYHGFVYLFIFLVMMGYGSEESKLLPLTMDGTSVLSLYLLVLPLEVEASFVKSKKDYPLYEKETFYKELLCKGL